MGFEVVLQDGLWVVQVTKKPGDREQMLHVGEELMRLAEGKSPRWTICIPQFPKAEEAGDE